MTGRLLAILACLASPVVAADNIASTPLFDATLMDLDNKSVHLERYRGRPLLVNFWARWCGPCRQEIPELVRERARLKDKGFEVLGIAIEERVEAVRDFARAYEIDYPVLLARDKGLPLMQALGNHRAGLPYTIAVDRQGRVVASKLGGMTRADIEAASAAAVK